MIRDINDLLDISTRIKLIEGEREKLALELKKMNGVTDQSLETTSKSQTYQDIYEDIRNNASSLCDIIDLKGKYGDLEILLQLELMLKTKIVKEENMRKLSEISNSINILTAKDLELIDYSSIYDLSTELKEVIESIDPSDKQVIELAATITADFNGKLLDKVTKNLEEITNEQLLASKWDTTEFKPSSAKVALDLRAASSNLFKHSQLYICDNMEKKLLNFKSIAYNFKIRFTYHFHDSHQMTMKTYFQFLNNYLLENLYKCINIFHDESNGIPKELVHEQFINHILNPIRDKVKISLSSQNDFKSIIVLISQILITDKNLKSLYQYKGVCLASLVPSVTWEAWVKFESETASRQAHNIMNNPKNLEKSGNDFVKLLNKMYEYLESFYNLEYEPIEKYKLMTCSQIFLNSSAQYLEYVLETDSLEEKRTKEDELLQTMIKLENLSVVYKKIMEFSEELVFIQLTDLVNKTEFKKFHSLFQNISYDYYKNIDVDIKRSIIQRIQKIIKETLLNYFKISSWSSNNSVSMDESTDISMSSELVNSIKMLNILIQKLDSLETQPGITLSIKNELLNVIVNYFIESILKLNKFNRQGLLQFEHDYRTLKACLNIPDELINSQDMILQETVIVLNLRYGSSSDHYTSSKFIKQGNFDELRENLNIRFLSESELQDALYRIAYGNII